MGSQKTHKVFVQMAKQIERMSCHNESCSAPSPHSVTTYDLVKVS